jgi:predicted aspartyl protease
MIVGNVDAEGIPTIPIVLGGRSWRALVDTGCNGDLELPDALRGFVNPLFRGQVVSLLAGDQVITEDYYQVEFPFDGETIIAEATFVSGRDILIVTHLLKHYRLEVNFPNGTVLLERFP